MRDYKKSSSPVTQAKKPITEANKQQNPRIKSLRLSGSRLAVTIARQAKSSTSIEELSRFSIAQSTIATAMSIVEFDFQRANRLLDMARSLANANVLDEESDGQQNTGS